MENLIDKITMSDNTVLIIGRTGSGKSHLAKEIHDRSLRKDRKFVAINLATLSENLIESELFGHERGAFSGADTKRIGKLEMGNGGTIFLDEIGELPVRLQTKLLEALNSKIICPVGSNRELQLDIRIIAATNKNLAKLVEEGSFREDLWFRINTFQIELPNLAGSPERIQTLTRKFLEEAIRRQNAVISEVDDSFFSAILNYSWPGNIRELRNAIDFAVAISTGTKITGASLPAQIRSGKPLVTTAPDLHLPLNYYEAKSHFERVYLSEMLRRFEGRINLTSRKTGISKVTLIEKVRRYEIDVNTIKYQASISQQKEKAI